MSWVFLGVEQGRRCAAAAPHNAQAGPRRPTCAGEHALLHCMSCKPHKKLLSPHIRRPPAPAPPLMISDVKTDWLRESRGPPGYAVEQLRTGAMASWRWWEAASPT